MARFVIMQSPSGEVFETIKPEYHPECTNLGTGPKAKQALSDYKKTKMREFIKPGDVIYYNVESVSSSGMTREITFYVAQAGDKGKPYIRNITGLIGDVLGYSQGKTGGLKVVGCGMNMGFHVVYCLGRALYPDGFGVQGTNTKGKDYTPKTRKQAQNAVKRGVIFRGRNADASGWDNDGGYALGYSGL